MACIWDAANKGAGIVLGRGATVAGKNASNGAWQSVRGTVSQSTGKFYLEGYVNAWDTNSGIVFGFGNSSLNTASYVGSSTASFGLQFRPGTTTIIIYNAGTLATLWSSTNVMGTAVGVAIDLDAKLIWFRTDRNTVWNNNGAADPATGIGGISYATTGALFPAFSALDAIESDCLTLNAGAYPFSMAAPSGFPAWDTGLPSPNGKTGGAISTWNPSDKHAEVALSGSDLIATQNTTANTFRGVRSTTSYGSGLVCLEMALTLLGSGTNFRGFIGGLANSGAALVYAGSDVKGSGFQSGDQNFILYNASGIALYVGSQTQGHVYMIAFDANKGLWWVKNVTTGSNWNNSASADPAAGLLGSGVPTTADIFAMWGGGFLGSTESKCTVNFGVTSFVGTKPTGYSGWDDFAGGVIIPQQSAVSVIS